MFKNIRYLFSTFYTKYCLSRNQWRDSWIHQWDSLVWILLKNLIVGGKYIVEDKIKSKLINENWATESQLEYMTVD